MPHGRGRGRMEPASIDIRIEVVTEADRLKALLTSRLPNVRFRDRNDGSLLQIIPSGSYAKARQEVERILTEFFD